MSVQIVHFSTTPDRVVEVEKGIADLMSALGHAKPSGIEYSASRLGELPEFLLTLTLMDGADNPLLRRAAATEFRGKIADWAGAPVAPVVLRPLGRYAG